MKNNFKSVEVAKSQHRRIYVNAKPRAGPPAQKIDPNLHLNNTKIWLLASKNQESFTKSPNKDSQWRSVSERANDYLKNSTLHGLTYVGDNNLSFIDRFSWLVIFLIAVSFSAYFITIIYTKYTKDPVIISLNPSPTPVEQVPFPAVTICNMNGATKMESELIMLNGTETEKSFLEDVCDFNDSLRSSSVVDAETGDWKKVLEFMWKISQPCEEMLKVCRFRSEEIECNQIFESILTDMGLCCTFNMLPSSYILREPLEESIAGDSSPDEYKLDQIDDWNPERGYAPNTTNHVFPFRSLGAGALMGLNLVLDANVHNYYCSRSGSTGFRVLLHNPMEVPKMEGASFMIPTKCEIRMVFKPSINDATESLRTMDIAKRSCYFNDEKYLRYFRTYSTSNCKLECKANITEKYCGCIPYYLPKNPDRKVCGKLEEECVSQVVEMMDLNQTPIKEEKDCHCSPSCFQLSYDKSMSYGRLATPAILKPEMLKNKTPEYFMENMAIVQIYFVNTQFNKFTTSEIYGFSEFLSNTGGILGLFLGFSFLSTIELLYHISLKVLCSTLRAKIRNRPQKKIIAVRQKKIIAVRQKKIIAVRQKLI